MQIWQSEHPGDDKIIAFFNQSVYKANPKPDEISTYISELKANSIPFKNAVEIPLHYIREIVMQEGKNYFEVQFGSGSTENFVINDPLRRLEIFEYLKKNLPVESSTVTYSKIRSAKKPLIALVVVVLIFLWTLYIAINVEKGSDYEVVGQAHSLAGIVLMIAYMGVQNVVLIFGTLILIAGFAFVKKFTKPPTFHRLVIKR